MFLSFRVDPLNWQSFNEIGEMACSTTAWYSRGHALKPSHVHTFPHWITAHHIIVKPTILLKLYIYETLNKRHTLLSRTRHITLYHVIPHHSTPYHEKEHCKTSHHTLSCHTTPQHTISWKRTLPHVISHFSMPCKLVFISHAFRLTRVDFIKDFFK